ncbi:MAG: hypothetical protein GTO41_29135 [Burkholderiales bacterium]|nr:hypothetical protein [Burkholderiales bacterium]
MSIALAISVGIDTAAIGSIGIVQFQEGVTVLKVISIAIIIGAVGLNALVSGTCSR